MKRDSGDRAAAAAVSAAVVVSATFTGCGSDDNLHGMSAPRGPVNCGGKTTKAPGAEMLRIVPADFSEASFALGVPKWKTITRIVLLAGLSGIITGVMLALARVMGETAPLLVLVGYSAAMNFDMFTGFMGSLPGMMYDQTSAGAGANPISTDRLWGAALTLILLIALINVGARVVAKLFAPDMPGRSWSG